MLAHCLTLHPLNIQPDLQMTLLTVLSIHLQNFSVLGRLYREHR